MKSLYERVVKGLMKRIPSGSCFAINEENPRDVFRVKDDEEVIVDLEEKGYSVLCKPTESEVYFEKMLRRALRKSPLDKWVGISLRNMKNFAYGDSPEEVNQKMKGEYNTEPGECALKYNHSFDNITYAVA